MSPCYAENLMKSILVGLLIAAGLTAATPKKPKLIVAIVIDQFRYDYLTRFRSEYHGGIDRLLTRGAVFTDARYIHFPTVTAVGHSTFLTGATPSVSGIVANEWFDRDENRRVTSVTDGATLLLGGANAVTTGESPRRLLVDTIGDEVKMADAGQSKVIGVSLKDRAAILPAGHMANAAYWFDNASGNFVSSTYYFHDLPDWVKDFNKARPGDEYCGATWLTHKMPATPKELYGDSLFSPFTTSPFANEVLERFAERILSAEALGTHDTTDILTVSFSSNDLVGHTYGPYSEEVHDISLQTDKQLGRLIAAAERQAGPNNTLVILTADHGVAPSGEESQANHMPGGRMAAGLIQAAITSALSAKFGEGDWISGLYELFVYFNRDLIAKKNLDPALVERVAAEGLYHVDHVARVYTRSELIHGEVGKDEISRRVENGYNLRRGADLEIVPEPYWTVGDIAASHATPYSYDNHVPVIFYGPGIAPGVYHQPIAVNDIAPTLAVILNVETPSGSVGRALTEMFQ
jgi:predicted AlkP superfamily pyrophosphatase or phosphodiesterase